MDFETIYESIENGSLKLSNTDIVNIVVASLTKDDVIDCDAIQEVITALQGIKKTAKDEFKELKKKIDSQEKEELAKKGLAYFKTLKVGDPISWIKSDGTKMTGTVGEQKKGAITAHVLLNELPTNSTAKTPKLDRYVKFHAIIIPN